MATPAQTITITEFESRYGEEKPNCELWYGVAVQKSMPTWIHGLLQRIVMELLRGAGFKAASEVRLNIQLGLHPVPDVIATRGRIEIPYPTRPVEVVVEILSDNDGMSRLLTKCRAYQGWGVQEIYVVDSSARVVFRWHEHRLEEVEVMAAQPVSLIWLALDQEIL